MLELYVGLWVMKADSGRVTLYLDAFDTQIGGTPHFMQHEFCILRIEN